MSDRYDCVVCGEIGIDLPLRTVDRSLPLEQIRTAKIDAIQPGGGGIVSNSGLAMAKLGLNVGAFGFVGNDIWADRLYELLEAGGLDTSHLLRHGSEATSATAVVVGEDGEHSFIYHAGASRCLDKATILNRIDLFEQSRFALFGYYALMPELEKDLPEVFS